MEKSVFLIAGEASGDALGSSLMRGLADKGFDANNFLGIGGPLMEAEGLKSLLPMDDLCVMGLWEVIWQLPRLLKLINGVVEEIEKAQPDIVVSIDLPDFNFQVAQRLKKRAIFKGKIVHYVAPSVWAWRPGRAQKVSEYLDGLMCLFPFEPAYFEPHGLRASYVGHPVVEVDRASIDRSGFRARREISDDSVCVGLFFGSREEELKSLSRSFLDTIEVLQEQYGNIELIVPTLPGLEYNVMDLLQDVAVPYFIVKDTHKKWDAMAACDVALAASGTVGLELSYLGVPHIIGYKAHPLTVLIVKLMAKVQYVHLANILLDEEVVPEYLQGRCNVNNLTRGMMRLIGYPEEREKQRQSFVRLQDKLNLETGNKPSQDAAAFIMDMF